VSKHLDSGRNRLPPIASASARTRAPLNVVFNLTPGAVLITPNELGPTIRKPELRTISKSR